MHDRGWTAYFTARLKRAQKELADFERAVAEHGLRTFHRDVHGEIETTEQSRCILQEAVAEYERVLQHM